MTLSLLAYVALLLMVQLKWAAVAKGLVWPVIDVPSGPSKPDDRRGIPTVR